MKTVRHFFPDCLAICFATVFLTVLLSASMAGAEKRTIAYSDAWGVDVQLDVRDGENWCQKTIRIYFTVTDISFFRNQTHDEVIKEVGPLLKGLCTEFEEAYVEGREQATNTLLYQGTAAERDQWRFQEVFMKSLSRAERLANADRVSAKALLERLTDARRPEKLAVLFGAPVASLNSYRDLIGRAIISKQPQIGYVMVQVSNDGKQPAPALWPEGITASLAPGLDPLTPDGWYLAKGSVAAKDDPPGSYPGGILVIESWLACEESACGEANDATALVKRLYPDVDIQALTSGQQGAKP